MAIIGIQIKLAKEALQEGKVVAIPTETVYGLSGNVFDNQAILSIFNIKKRPLGDPLIVHTDSLESAKTFVEYIPHKACLLAKVFWPGPLTLLLPKKSMISDIVTAGSAYVGVRVPNHKLALQLLKELSFPLAAPSANLFGCVSPTTAKHVDAQLGNHIPYILDGGPCAVGVESTILACQGEKLILRRLGGITKEQIEAVVGPIEEDLTHGPCLANVPGTGLTHYAPKKKIIVGDLSQLIAKYAPVYTVGVLSFKKRYSLVPKAYQVVLSCKGSLSQAAQNLFSGLHLLDNLPIDLILAEYMPEKGLGKTINDRLYRAQCKST